MTENDVSVLSPLVSKIRVILGQHKFNVTTPDTKTFGVEKYIFPDRFSVFNPTLHDIGKYTMSCSFLLSLIICIHTHSHKVYIIAHALTLTNTRLPRLQHPPTHTKKHTHSHTPQSTCLQCTLCARSCASWNSCLQCEDAHRHTHTHTFGYDSV